MSEQLAEQITFSFVDQCLRPLPEIHEEAAFKLALAVCAMARVDAAHGQREAQEFQKSEFFSLALYVAQDRLRSRRGFDAGAFFRDRHGQGRKPGSGGRRATARGMRRLFEEEKQGA